MDRLYTSLLEAYKNGTFDDALSKLAALPPYLEKVNTDYVPYPDLDDPHFYEKLTAKKEFFAASQATQKYGSYDEEARNRCNDASFKIAPHQLFVKRFLSPQTPYNGLLLYHSVGVGKTCSAISIAEQYIGLYKKRVLVILSSTLKENFKKQIFDITRYNMEKHVANLCTGVKYPEMVIDRKMIPKDVFEKRINKLINDRYQFLGYKELMKLMEKVKKRVENTERDPAKHERRYIEKVRELFSDRLIIIDEAHNLRMASETGTKLISTAFLELVSIVDNVKLLLMTATPMFNDPREIIWILNLFLMNDKRPLLKIADVFDVNGKLTKAGQTKLASTVRGYVSFMRGENPFSFPFRIHPADKNVIKDFPSIDIKGKKIPISSRIKNLRLTGSELAPKQIIAYEELMPRNWTDDSPESSPGDEDDNVSNDVQNMLQLCNIVYPTENVKRCFGKTGFMDCFNKNKGGKNTKFEYRNGLEQFLSYDTIGKYGPKLKRILDYTVRSDGIVFIYSQYYYSGIIPIALALEHAGFNKLGGNLGDKLAVQQKAPLIKGKRPNYVILSRDKELSPNNDKEIAMARSLENVNGDLIKVVIVSKIGTEGLDFKNIREMHLLDPWYNMNRAEQIIGRGVRTCSHIDLPKEKRNTSIYMHAVTMPDDAEESVDLRVYRIAENKQEAINAVENVMKSAAIDCQFNKDALHFPVSQLKMSFDIVTSQNDKIKYDVGDKTNHKGKCLFELQTKIDPSTFDGELISDEVDMYKQYLVLLFKDVEKMTYDDIVSSLQRTYKAIDNDIINYALTDMIDNGELFDGYMKKKGRLTYSGNKYVFVVDGYSTDVHHKPRLPLEVLASSKQNAPITNDDANAKAHGNADTQGITGTAVIAFIEGEVAKILKHVNAKYEDQVIDAVIDRLSTEQLIGLISFINQSDASTRSPFETKVVASVESAGFTIPDSNRPDKIQAFYNHIDQNFYCGKSQCTPLESTKISKEINSIKARLYKAHGNNVKGFVHHKDGAAKFKVRDGSTNGYVCFQTHSLQVDELKNRLNALDDKAYDQKAKLSKAKLCEVYEALLRKEGKIVRPFLAGYAKK